MSTLRLGRMALLAIAGIFALAILAAPVQFGAVNAGLTPKSAHADNNNGNNSNNPPTTEPAAAVAAAAPMGPAMVIRAGPAPATADTYHWRAAGNRRPLFPHPAC